MSEQPEETRELDLSEIPDEPDEETVAKADAVPGEPGWDGSGTTIDEAPASS